MTHFSSTFQFNFLLVGISTAVALANDTVFIHRCNFEFFDIASYRHIKISETKSISNEILSIFLSELISN